MDNTHLAVTRRSVLKSVAAVAAAAALPSRRAHGDVAPTATPGAKYKRHNVMSAGGQRALASYAKGVSAMLKLPPADPRNWFRNAFIHLMDCPHGNWWFFVWHRGYLGYFEQTIRSLSGDGSFAMPYWDWTTLPQIPPPMFAGLLTPRDAAFAPYMSNLAAFTGFAKPALQSYWSGLDAAQIAQLKARGYASLDNLWNDVTGFDPSQKPPHGVAGNIAYAPPCGARYLTANNPKLDAKTAYDVSEKIVYAGLAPVDFYNADNTKSFNSSKTASHNAAPGGSTSFAILEAFPHNKVHNYIGGVGPLDPGPYGYMTNFLSPVDPIFFLHHANMDRLWDVWTRKQKRYNQPYLPTGAELAAFSGEPFLFFVDDKGQYVIDGKAGDYVEMSRFDYEYEPGFGEKIVEQAPGAEAVAAPAMQATLQGNVASLDIPTAAVKSHLQAPLAPSLLATITLPRPSAQSVVREFDVIVGAPPEVTQVSADSPYYAGTIAFFGSMTHMHDMPLDATFTVPLPTSASAFHDLAAESTPVSIRVVPSQVGEGGTTVVSGVTVRALR